MQVDIQSLGFSLSPALSGYAQKRIDCALSFAATRISRLMVRLSDINGRRGGDDKRCLIEVRVKGAPGIVIEDVEANLYVAIDRAVERAKRSLVRRLGQAREIPRRHSKEGNR